MITLQQIAQASQSDLKAGIVEHIIETSPALSRIPFVEAPSLRYEWSMQTKLPASGFRALSADYPQSNSEYDRGTIHLKPLGGTFRIDRLLADVPDINRARFVETEIRARARSASMAFKKSMIKGNSANPAEFDGLQKWFDAGILTEQVDLAAAGTTFAALGAAGTLAKMHEALNSSIVMPDFILANRTIISQLASLALASAANEAFAQYFRMTKMDIGNGRMISVGSFYEIPIIPLDTDETGAEILSFTEASPNGGNTACASMYFVTVGESYFTGVQQTNAGPRIFEYTTDAGHKAVSVDWPSAIAVEHPRAVVRLRGIKES